MQKRHFQLFQVRARVDIHHIFNTTLRAWNTCSENYVRLCEIDVYWCLFSHFQGFPILTVLIHCLIEVSPCMVCFDQLLKAVLLKVVSRYFVVKKEIDKYALINYSLVSSPNFTESYTDIFIKVSKTKITVLTFAFELQIIREFQKTPFTASNYLHWFLRYWGVTNEWNMQMRWLMTLYTQQNIPSSI